MEIRLKDVKVGEQFTLVNNKYTKLNEHGYCLLDEYGKDVPNWSKFQPFDGKDDCSNDFDKSTIKEFINSDYFWNDVLEIIPQKVTLLSIEEFEEYKDIIKTYSIPYWLRSNDDNNNYYSMLVHPSGSTCYGDVNSSIGVRPAVYFTQDYYVKVGDDDKIAELRKQIEELQKQIEALK